MLSLLPIQIVIGRAQARCQTLTPELTHLTTVYPRVLKYKRTKEYFSFRIIKASYVQALLCVLYVH